MYGCRGPASGLLTCGLIAAWRSRRYRAKLRVAMALPNDIRTLFHDLPTARAEREARAKQAVLDREEAERLRAEERRVQRDALRAELAVAWDWLQGDGQELAAEMCTANFMRLELVGPIDPSGAPCEWQLDARTLVLMQDGQLEVVRQDEYRALRYLAPTADAFLDVEPPGVTRAFIEAVRSGEVWRRVGRQLREATAPAVVAEI